MKQESIEVSLKHSVLFEDLTDGEISACAEYAQVRYLLEGECVCRQNTATNLFHIIAVGEVELVQDFEDSTSGLVGRIGRGGHFGEAALLTGKGHATTIRALSDTVLISFDREDFFSKLMVNEGIRHQIEKSLAERLRVSFFDQAELSRKQSGYQDRISAGNMVLFKGKETEEERAARREEHSQEPIQNISVKSRAAREIQKKISEIAANDRPLFIYGEKGTGRSIISKQIHLQSLYSEGPYHNIDLREYEGMPVLLEKKLFGEAQGSSPFFQTRRTGYFEQTCNGTLVFEHIELLSEILQERLLKVLHSSVYTHWGSDQYIAMQSRIVFVSAHSLEQLKAMGRVIPGLIEIFEAQNFTLPALRDHKQDLPRLIDHYLARFSHEYNKQVDRVSPATLGVLMNYDWPGNLTELSTVIRRAVMLAPSSEVHSEQILLGLPKTEGKWEFNLLRLPFVRRFLRSNTYPAVPQKIVGGVLLLAIFSLFFGTQLPEDNIGLTISWYIGWPLMFFSFFFLARTWCSVCTLAMPGKIVQHVIKPKRKIPTFVKRYSAWIMAIFCVLIFWVEIVWDAYRDPVMTGCIILTITVGSLLFSAIFTRRAWCRYICPLGAVNAIFAMPSILELRSNRHVCLNKCQEHACFGGTGEELSGCPMFRHPYLVDNNRDCIFCGECIKNCNNRSIQLNLRLAPQELWSLEAPRMADAILIVALGAILFPFSLGSDFSEYSYGVLGEIGASLPQAMASSIVFFGVIAFALLVYSAFIAIQAQLCHWDKKELFVRFAYGLIPLILGSYLAVHMELFMTGAGVIVPQILNLFGQNLPLSGWEIMNEDSLYVLQVISVLNGFLASLYATSRVGLRFEEHLTEKLSGFSLSFPVIFLAGLCFIFLGIL